MYHVTFHTPTDSKELLNWDGSKFVVAQADIQVMGSHSSEGVYGNFAPLLVFCFGIACILQYMYI